MKRAFGDTPAAVWIVLCALTFASVLWVEGGWWPRFAPLLVVLIAAFKSRLVILNYMEARRAHPLWRLFYETWNFAAAATIAIGYFIASSHGRP
jgi:hypothetical protein